MDLCLKEPRYLSPKYLHMCQLEDLEGLGFCPGCVDFLDLCCDQCSEYAIVGEVCPGCEKLHIKESKFCSMDCRLCECGPEIIVPLITGQKGALRKVLKELWENIDYFMAIRKGRHWTDAHSQAEELLTLLNRCKFTCAYLDIDSGSDILRTNLKEILSRVYEHECSHCETLCDCTAPGLGCCCWSCAQLQRKEEKKRKIKKRKGF